MVYGLRMWTGISRSAIKSHKSRWKVVGFDIMENLIRWIETDGGLSNRKRIGAKRAGMVVCEQIVCYSLWSNFSV